MSDSPNSSTHSVSHCFKDKTMRKWWLLQSSEPGTTATKTFRIILTQPPRVPSGLPPAVLDLQAAVERRPLPHTHTRGAVWVLCESRYWGLAWSCTTGCYWWGGKHLQVCAPHRPWDQQTCGSPGLAWPGLAASEKALNWSSRSGLLCNPLKGLRYRPGVSVLLPCRLLPRGWGRVCVCHTVFVSMSCF